MYKASNITWKIKNGSIAKLYKNGKQYTTLTGGNVKIKAIKNGTTTVTASLPNGNKATCTITVAKTIKITFKANGGTGGGTQVLTYGAKGQKLNVNCSRTGFSFVKWNTKADGSGRSYTYRNAISDSWIQNHAPTETLYAIWKANSFKNPLMYGQDPWVYKKDKYYYYIRSTGNGIQIFKTDILNSITKSGGKVVYWNGSSSIWAPELHYFNGHWYIYAAIVYGSDASSRRMYVLESTSSDPLGNYNMIGQLSTGGWAIDGTVLTYNNRLYFVWSGWPGSYNWQQNIYIAPMSSPKTISGGRVLISTPSQWWEVKNNDPYVNEGPQVLKHNGNVFIIYSANGSWGPNYCLASLKLNGSNPLNARAWTKSNGPVFSSGNGVYGPGHACFVKSPDGKEDWIVYHGNTNPYVSTGDPWWADRKIFMQRFSWYSNGNPNFGSPLPTSTIISPASGTK